MGGELAARLALSKLIRTILVTKAAGNGCVTVKKFEARARGKEVPAAWVFLNNTFMTPASGNRPRLDNLIVQ